MTIEVSVDELYVLTQALIVYMQPIEGQLRDSLGEKAALESELESMKMLWERLFVIEKKERRKIENAGKDILELANEKLRERLLERKRAETEE